MSDQYAELQAFADQAEMPMIMTAYSAPARPEQFLEDVTPEQAAERDLLLRQRIVQVLREQAPWLVPILRAADATVGVDEAGRFLVMMRGGYVEIPGLSAHFVLKPWAEAHEIRN